MARRNDSGVGSPQEVRTSQQVAARLHSAMETTSRDPAGLREIRSVSGEPENVEIQNKGAKDSDSTNEDLQSDDAAVIAKMINVASFSGTNAVDSNSAHKPRDGNSALEYTGTTATDSSHTTPDSSDGNAKFTLQSSTSQNERNPRQFIPRDSHSISISSNRIELSTGNSLSHSGLIHGDISKTQKAKRSGRPDLYDIPLSPPRISGVETDLSVPRRRGLKPKRAPQQPKSQQAPIIDEDPGEDQTHIEYTRSFSGHGTIAALGAGERIAVRSNRKHEKHHLNDVNGSPNSQGFQYATNQAGDAVAEPVHPKTDPRGYSKMKFPANNSQSTANPHVTRSKRDQKVETVSTNESIPSRLQGLSPVSSDPTPAQRIHPSHKRLQRPTNRSSQDFLTRNDAPAGSRPHSGNKGTVNSPVQESLIDEDDDDSKAYESSPPSSPLVTVSRPKAESATISLDRSTMSKMMEIIKEAGCNPKGEKIVADDSFRTKLGSIFTKGLRSLITTYQSMTSLDSERVVDVGKFDQKHQKVLKLIGDIHKKSDEVLITRLGSKGSGGKNADLACRKNMLVDLYLHIVPGLVKALNCATKSRPDRKRSKSSDLEELYILLKVLHDLVKAARAEDKFVQPKPPPQKRYRISQPTRNLWPILSQVYKACGHQLIARKFEQLQRTAPARSKKRKERLEVEERLAEQEFQERLKQRNEAIIASLDERRAELGLPPCGQPLAAMSASLRTQGSRHKGKDTIHDVNYDMSRRLTGVFGRNNSHPGTIPKEWTKVEMEILVNGLRDERGPTRYEKLASQLDRTLDEIFDRAKYLKMQIEYTLKRLQEEQPDKEFPPVKPWVENIGSEGFLNGRWLNEADILI